MAYLAGEPIVNLITLRDSSGDAVTGAVWTVLFSKHQNGTAALTTIEETASPGTYLISTETLAVGAYHLIAVATKDGQSYPTAGTSHVISRGAPFEHYVDQPVEEVLYLIDDSSIGLSGVTFETDISSDPNGDPFVLSSSPITGVPGGYLIQTTPDVAGVWSAEITTDTTPERRYQFTASVFPTGQAVTGAALSGSGQVTWQRITTFRGTVTWSRLT